jgi:transcriptional regulator with XRE-family HTH domain
MLSQKDASMLFDELRKLAFMTFGKRLSAAMEAAEKDRAALAAALGVSVQAIGQTIRSDSKSMTAENAAKAARFLGVDLYWLATGEGEPKGASSWPFAPGLLDRATKLQMTDLRYVEGKLESAIERCEEVSKSRKAA